MIEFIFRINHPRPNDRTKQTDYVVWDKRLSKNWAAELQISRMPLRNIFEIYVDTSWTGKDHAGPRLELTVFNWFFNFQIYNVNHWNWNEGRFYTKEEALAEYEEDQQWREENGIDQDPEDKYAKWANKA
jgi:hypothetical protein